MSHTPDLSTIEAVATKLGDYIVHTPTVRYCGVPIEGLDAADVFIKLELLQHGGSCWCFGESRHA